MPEARFLKGTITVLIICLCSCIIACGGQPRPDHKADYDVIVIGSGMGGLSAATHCALGGLKVLVLEQHYKVGGCTSSFSRGDFVFDAALHEMAGGGPGRNDRGLFRLLKATGVDKKITFIELPDFYRSVFPGIDITLPNNWEGFKKALKDRWPEESEGIEKFHLLCSSLLGEFMDLKDLFRYGKARALLVKAMVPLRQRTFFKWKDRTVKDLMDECFKSEDIKAVVSQLWVYYGAPVPEQTALLFMAATDSYLSDGIWHIKGTSQALSNAYAERIIELGGTVMTGTLVTKILLDGTTATGVETADGKKYSARYIVANTDPYQLSFKLIGEKNMPAPYMQKLKSLKPANSLFGAYLGLNFDLKKLGYHDTEIIYNASKDSMKKHDAMMTGDYANGAVAITVYSNYGDPIYAPKGKSVVTLTAYSDAAMWPRDREAYNKLKDRKVDDLIALAAKVIPELVKPGVIAVKEGYTPRTLERYTRNRGGVVYGFRATPDQWEKVPNTTPVHNVYIASNWSQAWHGVGSCQVNGWRAARLILDREGKP